MLLGIRILLVEDEFLLANELASYFSDCGATVLGPVSSVSRARRYIDLADGAVLDIDLNGETVFPLADELSNRGIPFVFFSGNDQITLPGRFRYTQNLSKPAGFRTVVGILAAQTTLGDDSVSAPFQN
jgi:CheY-like chemotaxis protein